jgi:hypothetical protein
MDLSPQHSGHSNTGKEETVDFDLGMAQGLFKEEEQEIKFEEGPPTQENVFCTAFSNHFSILSPYLQRLDPQRQSWIDPLPPSTNPANLDHDNS